MSSNSILQEMIQLKTCLQCFIVLLQVAKIGLCLHINMEANSRHGYFGSIIMTFFFTIMTFFVISEKLIIARICISQK